MRIRIKRYVILKSREEYKSFTALWFNVYVVDSMVVAELRIAKKLDETYRSPVGKHKCAYSDALVFGYSPLDRVTARTANLPNFFYFIRSC